MSKLTEAELNELKQVIAQVTASGVWDGVDPDDVFGIRKAVDDEINEVAADKISIEDAKESL